MHLHMESAKKAKKKTKSNRLQIIDFDDVSINVNGFSVANVWCTNAIEGVPSIFFVSSMDFSFFIHKLKIRDKIVPLHMVSKWNVEN